ncbi:hypothetical protein SDC9_78783 [bioreactor metagenome]|uniref:Uncharacterized protein n=1 Tax=bioreactor metagenome TaxID=1076179 RepID=A0A644YWJ1_9ZZZZ
MRCANAFLFCRLEHHFAVGVVAKASDHLYLRPQTRRLHGLIEAFSAGEHFKAFANNRFAVSRKTIRLHDQIHDKTANY